jgi:hypothetical protein
MGFAANEWQQHFVAELDSALNKWMGSVPQHRRSPSPLLHPVQFHRYGIVIWDPCRELGVFFDQSLILHSFYYYVRILVHRQFISSPRKPSPLPFPSLTICTNAAKSCIQMVDLHLQRKGAGSAILDTMVSDTSSTSC